MTNDLRKLVTISQISEIVPMDADAIIGYRVRGWVVVDSKDKYQLGDHVIYFEPDAFLPVDVPEFAFLEARGVKEALHEGENVRGHVLRTIKLRGQISQGLILPLSFGLTADSTQDEITETFSKLGVFKYEPPLPTGGGEQIAPFPARFARKTDSERVQNVSDEWLQSLDPSEWFASEKIDGTSATFWKVDGEIHVAGRNWELSTEGDHPHARLARELNLQEIMPDNSVVQGEIYGEGIQKNPLKVNGLHLAVFWHGFSRPVEEGDETRAFHKWAEEHSTPLVDLPFPRTVLEAIEQTTKMKSLVNPKVLAEGVVWWNKSERNYAEIGDRPNFKSINSAYLLKHGG